MHIVYKLTFKKRLRENSKPYYYIGSKSNSYVVDGIIIDKNNKRYYGSSTYEGYNEIVSNDDIVAEILFESNDYQEVLNMEREIQLSCSANTSLEYFNRSIATTSNFTDPEYASYKHKDDPNMIVRLKRDSDLVKNGEYVGITRGRSVVNDKNHRNRACYGPKNGWYGRSHSKETMEIIASKNRGQKRTMEQREHLSQIRKGKPKSDDWKQKMSNYRKGKTIMIKGDETLLVKKCDIDNYKSDGWEVFSHGKGKELTNKIFKCSVCGKDNLSSAHLSMWHGEKCGTRTFFAPWTRGKSFANPNIFMELNDIIVYLKSIEDEYKTLSKKSFYIKYIIPYAKMKFNIDNIKGSEYNTLKKIVNAFYSGKINNESIESYNNWRKHEISK